MYAYPYDIAVIVRNKRGSEKNLVKLDSEAQKGRLKINEDKTKYMEVRRNATNNRANLTDGNFTYTEHVEQLSCLGSQTAQTSPVL